ncbi:hypothetical protein PCE1_003411 [Barthelona sp. PCE]
MTTEPQVANPQIMRMIELKQCVEFYFSESNLQKDEYLRSLMDESGWVPIVTILTFHRMKLLNATFADFFFLLDSEIVDLHYDMLRIRSKVHNYNPQPFKVVVMECMPFGYSRQKLKNTFDSFSCDCIRFKYHLTTCFVECIDEDKATEFIGEIQEKGLEKATFVARLIEYEEIYFSDNPPVRVFDPTGKGYKKKKYKKKNKGKKKSNKSKQPKETRRGPPKPKKRASKGFPSLVDDDQVEEVGFKGEYISYTLENMINIIDEMTEEENTIPSTLEVYPDIIVETPSEIIALSSRPATKQRLAEVVSNKAKNGSPTVVTNTTTE